MCLCIALRSAIHEWPQTVWGPVEHCFGFVCQGFGLRIIRKLVGIVSGYFDYHAATLQNKRWRSLSLNCTIRNKRWTTGGGPREFLYVYLIVSSYFLKYSVSVRKRTLCAIPKMETEKDVPIQSSRQRFVMNGNYGRWGIGTSRVSPLLRDPVSSSEWASAPILYRASRGNDSALLALLVCCGCRSSH